MVAFSLASGLGLFAAGWLATRLGAARRPWASRILSVVLMVGAVLFVVRPVPTLASPDPEAQPACCELTHPHRW
jgi:thiol:disulfide interchange protein